MGRFFFRESRRKAGRMMLTRNTLVGVDCKRFGLISTDFILIDPSFCWIEFLKKNIVKMRLNFIDVKAKFGGLIFGSPFLLG